MTWLAQSHSLCIGVQVSNCTAEFFKFSCISCISHERRVAHGNFLFFIYQASFKSFTHLMKREQCIGIFLFSSTTSVWTIHRYLSIVSAWTTRIETYTIQISHRDGILIKKCKQRFHHFYFGSFYFGSLGLLSVIIEN